MGHRGPAAPLQAPAQQFLCWLMTCHLLAMSSEPLGDKTQLWLGIERPWEGVLASVSALPVRSSQNPHTSPYELCSLPHKLL